MKFAALSLLSVAPLVAGVIEGRVTNAVTGEGISGASVMFLDRGSHPYTTTTDATGSYRISGLADGVYRGEFSKQGFADSRQSGTLSDLLNGSSGVRVSGDVPARYDSRLQPWARLRGRVINEAGRPAAGVAVEISRNLENTVTTGEDGSFTFEELPAGAYTLVAKPKATVESRDGQTFGGVPVYYPSATQLAEASAIRLGAGAEVAGIEIRLRNIPVHRVSGVILDAGGKPVPHATASLLARSSAAVPRPPSGSITAPGPLMRQDLRSVFLNLAAPGAEVETASVQSREDGAFEFSAVPPGDWRIRADIDLDDHPRSGTASAIVSDKDVEGVQIRVAGSFSIPVTADWGDAQPPKRDENGPVPTGYLVHLVPEEGQPVLDFDAAGNVTSVNGAFPGRYRVTRALIAPGFYVAGVTYDGRDVLGQVIELEPGPGSLHVVVRHDPGSLKGSVEKANGATVFLVSRTAGDTVEYRSAICTARGAFSFEDVIPGDYYIAAFEHFGALPPDSLPALASLATPVTIQANGAALPVTLTLSTWPF